MERPYTFRVSRPKSARIPPALIISLSLAVAFFVFPPLLAQNSRPAETPLRDWVSTNHRWLLSQVTPNLLVPDPDPSRRGLAVSYGLSPEKFPQGFHRSAVYDDALAALAFLVLDDRDRAAFILHALARLVRADGSLWFGYNTANDWPSEADHDSALVRAGALSWVGYALAFYLAHQPPCAGDRGCERERAFFLRTAVRLGEYLLSLQVSDAQDLRDGLVRLGFGQIELAYKPDINKVVEIYTDGPYPGISTENNISAWFFLRQLGVLTGEARWTRAAERIRAGLLRAAWDDPIDQFIAGFRPDGSPDHTKALDCLSWGAIFFAAAGDPEKARRSLAVVDSRYAARDGESVGFRPYSDTPIYEDPGVGRFFFPDHPRRKWLDLPLVWSEGTLGVALANLRFGRPEQARRLLEGLRPLQPKGGGLIYASRDLPFLMWSAPGAASAAWLILVIEALSGNPLAQEIWK
ncbi:MAG: hypothetical protein H6P98_871 [Candidatus Aminicenantes bacterium]|nr:hypothetical protein [Candidatus Aminicenantes bacterium]